MPTSSDDLGAHKSRVCLLVQSQPCGVLIRVVCEYVYRGECTCMFECLCCIVICKKNCSCVKSVTTNRKSSKFKT